ncbi:MAG: acetoin dehydrogenase AcuB [Frankiales bacterium]|nr:acetoin dehydrogenase AcuB [Frankiales bacterium]
MDAHESHTARHPVAGRRSSVSAAVAAVPARHQAESHVDPRTLRARDVMSHDVVTVGSDATVAHALAVMRDLGVRHLPVLLDGRFAGLVDDRLVALAQVADAAPRSRPVASLMTHYVPQVSPDADLPRVARLVRDSGCDAVVVVVDGALVGLVTATDLVAALAGHRVPESSRATATGRAGTVPT